MKNYCDWEAIGSDWKAVGDDMWRAIEKYDASLSDENRYKLRRKKQK